MKKAIEVKEEKKQLMKLKKKLTESPESLSYDDIIKLQKEERRLSSHIKLKLIESEKVMPYKIPTEEELRLIKEEKNFEKVEFPELMFLSGDKENLTDEQNYYKKINPRNVKFLTVELLKKNKKESELGYYCKLDGIPTLLCARPEDLKASPYFIEIDGHYYLGTCSSKLANRETNTIIGNKYNKIKNRYRTGNYLSDEEKSYTTHFSYENWNDSDCYHIYHDGKVYEYLEKIQIQENGDELENFHSATSEMKLVEWYYSEKTGLMYTKDIPTEFFYSPAETLKSLFTTQNIKVKQETVKISEILEVIKSYVQYENLIIKLDKEPTEEELYMIKKYIIPRVKNLTVIDSKNYIADKNSIELENISRRSK